MQIRLLTQKLWRRVFVLWLTFCIAGCLAPIDVTNDARFRDDWVPQGVYELMGNAFLKKGHPVPELEWAAGGDIKDWESNPAALPDVLDVVPVGTHVQFNSVVRFSSIEDDMVLPFAVILDGPRKGTKVGLAPISKLVWDKGAPSTWSVNPKGLRYLESSDEKIGRPQ